MIDTNHPFYLIASKMEMVLLFRIFGNVQQFFKTTKSRCRTGISNQHLPFLYLVRASSAGDQPVHQPEKIKYFETKEASRQQIRLLVLLACLLSQLWFVYNIKRVLLKHLALFKLIFQNIKPLPTHSSILAVREKLI